MIGIIVVTHLDIATPLIEEAERVLGKQNNLLGLNLHANESAAVLRERLLSTIAECVKNAGIELEGFLILTDLFGSTPTNACVSQIGHFVLPCEILTGINLPMLISSLTYRNRLGLKELSEKVAADGQKGIKNAKR